MEKKYDITFLPMERTVQAYAGDSLYTLLLVNGLIDPEQPDCDRLRLEKGVVSDAEDEAAEAAVFTPAELAEDWILAGQRQVAGDAVLTLPVADLIPEQQQAPLARGYGLVVDIGTANLCAGLIKLDDMNIPLLTNLRNSQGELAEDTGARLAYCRKGEAELQEMSALLRGDLSYAAAKLCKKAGIAPREVQAISLAGNYPLIAMLLQQLPPAGWPPLGELIRRRSCELGLDGLDADTPLYILPAATPSLGGDIISSVLAANLLAKVDDERFTVLLDMGMRGELICVGRGNLLATSVPTMPFEGAGLTSGMSARTGAITGVSLGKRVVLRTVRDARPKGICGAGMLSVIHQMLRWGMLDEEGRLLHPQGLPKDMDERFRGTLGGREFVLSRADQYVTHDICVNQNDIHQVQLAKGSIYAACRAMLAAMDADESDVKEILLAEGSSANIRPGDALALGLLPRVDPARVIGIGNAAWQGAYLALTNQSYLDAATRAAQILRTLDLTSDLIYAEEFLKAMNFELPEEKEQV